MSRRRVFVTGVGVVSPHGEETDRVFQRICAGESAIVRIPSGKGDVATEVIVAPAEFEGIGLIPKARRMFMARAGQLAVVAAHHALEDAGLEARGPELVEAGVYMGCGLGGAEAIQAGYGRYFKGTRRGRPLTVPLIMANGPASHVSIELGIRGPTLTYSVACASSAISLGESFRAIRDGYLDRALAGGAEAQLNDGSLAAWENLGVVAHEHADGPGASSRPFDAERTGFVLGEGAAVLVLESEEVMTARGGAPVAEIVGYACTSDAHNLTEPFIDGQVRAMRSALGDANLEPQHVGYVSAHATGTPAGDPVEVEALKTVFGVHARTLSVSATKSMHGHLVGAAGALEAVLTVLALQRRHLPPTANLTRPDPELDLDFVPLVGRDAPTLTHALSNSFAFGGTNAALVMRRVD